MSHNDMLGFISILLEVQVMGDIVLFIGRAKANGHVEFTPSFFLNSKWRVLEY
jgi:hypothetical protein